MSTPVQTPSRVHPLARRALHTMQPPPPVSLYQRGKTERMFTNPEGGELRTYPSPWPVELQHAYAHVLTQELAERGQERAISPDMILFTAGSVAGVELLIRAFCEPSVDAIAIQTPVLQIFAHQARIENVEVRDIPLQGPSLDKLDVDAIVSARAKLTFVVRPSNPVGSVPEFGLIEELARKVEGLLVIDEAYMEFCDDLSALAISSPNVVVLRTFSKAYALAGVRAGAVIAHPDVLHTLRIVADPFAFDTPAQNAVSDALKARVRMKASVHSIRIERSILARRLSTLPGVKVFESSTNFLLLTTQEPIQLPKTELMVVSCGGQLKHGIRIGIGLRDENSRTFELIQSLVS